MSVVSALHAREILDSRGNPTLEVDVVLDDGSRGRAAVPAGASTGSREAKESRDGDSRYGGRGVRKAVEQVEGSVAAAMRGEDPAETTAFDLRLNRLDGTPDKSRLGANTILAVSMAAARAAAASRREPLYRFLARKQPPTLLPVPMFNVLNGGAHAENSLDFQEFMIAPVGAPNFAEALRYGAEVYQALKVLLKAGHMSVAVGDEGGFAPNLNRGEDAIEVILKAIEKAGLNPGTDVVIALDPAASELFEEGNYVFRKGAAGSKNSLRMVELFERWLTNYPAIWSIEDGLAEDDWPGWLLLTGQLGERVQLVGDDIFVTNPEIIRRAIREHVGNAALIKLNQIGTVSETLQAIAVAQQAGYGTVISHRSGETADDFIADLAVATGAGQIKSGAPARGERTAKYNQLLRIEQELGTEARYAGHHYSKIRSFKSERVP